MKLLSVHHSTRNNAASLVKNSATTQSDKHLHYNMETATSHNEVCTCAMIRRNEEGRLGVLRSMNWQQRQSREYQMQEIMQRVSEERRQRYKDVRNLKRRHQRVIERETSKE